MNTDRAKEFKPCDGQYRFVDALRDRLGKSRLSRKEVINLFNESLHCEFTDTVEEWERPDLGARPAGPRMYTPYKALDFERRSRTAGNYPDVIVDSMRACPDFLRACPDFYGTVDLRGCIFDGESEARPKNLWDGESYQPFINWEI